MTALPSIINPGYVRTMAAYNAEMNRRLYEAAGRLDDDERSADEGAFWSSITGTLCHIVWADQLWMGRFTGILGPDVAMADSAGICADFEVLAGLRAHMDRAICAWAGAVTEDWLAGTSTWMSMVLKREMTAPRSLLVTHMFNHQTHHRGQAHALITRAGEQTGDTDLPFVLAPDVLLAAMAG